MGRSDPTCSPCRPSEKRRPSGYRETQAPFARTATWNASVSFLSLPSPQACSVALCTWQYSAVLFLCLARAILHPPGLTCWLRRRAVALAFSHTHMLSHSPQFEASWSGFLAPPSTPPHGPSTYIHCPCTGPLLFSLSSLDMSCVMVHLCPTPKPPPPRRRIIAGVFGGRRRRC